MKIIFGKYLLRASFISISVFLCLLPLLIFLGYWQLQRAEEKRQIIARYDQVQESETLYGDALLYEKISELRYREIKLEGEYDNQHQFLIDNQIMDRRPGYYVLTPFKISGSDRAILVNRGWIPLTGLRSKLPNIDLNIVKTSIQGRINNFPSVGIKLAGAEVPTDTWPSVVQVVDARILSAKLAYELIPMQIELHQDQPDGYNRTWNRPWAMTPEKHTAYAFQWFGLALTLTILFFFYGWNRPNNE